jgi:D-tyrosyl-tRNA(Tyr) deacylase
MRAVVQRVSRASVSVAGEVVGTIGEGLLVLLGVGVGDAPEEADALAARVAHLRVFPDERGQMNRSCLDVGGAALVVSQFTLYGDCRRGRRPSYVGAAPPGLAEELYGRFAGRLARLGIPVATGRFGADMDVALVNRGPVTLLLDGGRRF